MDTARCGSLCVRAFQSDLAGVREKRFHTGRAEQCGGTDVARQSGNARICSVLVGVHEAQRIKTALENPEIPTLLRQLNGAGKCNWAQPGKIKKILEFDREA